MPPLADLPPAQVTAGSYALHAASEQPSLLAYPGPGVVNCAARAMALPVDWTRVQQLAVEIQDGAQADVVTVTRDSTTGDFAVPAEWLELVIAHALLDRPIAVDPVCERVVGEACHLDASKLYAVFRRAGKPPARRPHSEATAPREGWERTPSTLLLAAAELMSSRDLEAIVWPKAHHLALKMADATSHKERLRLFGRVPVRWVPEAARWMSGSRHRPMAALLSGRPLVAVPASGSVQPFGDNDD